MSVKQAGFKLFEFILVIALVGILFVVAIGYYLKLANEARRITFQALGHNYATAVTMAHAQWLIYRVDNTASNTLTINSRHVSFNALGWPLDMTSESGKNNCERLFNGMIQNNAQALSSWRGLLQATAILSTSGQENKLPSGFSILKMGPDWCRYELKAGSTYYFFDYLAVNGRVSVHTTNK